MRHLLLFVYLVSHQALAEGSYTDVMYSRALQNSSTSPSYVLISLSDGPTLPPRSICIPAPFLLGAIHLEYGIPYDNRGIAKALSLAISRPGKAFSFSNPKAKGNIQIHYTENHLKGTRERLSAMTDVQLRGKIENQDDSIAGDIQDAVAHVLLERGISVGIADLTGRLYLTD